MDLLTARFSSFLHGLWEASHGPQGKQDETHQSQECRRLFLGVLQVAAVLLLLAGCGGSKGPVRYDLSGKVTFRGAAVPHGLIFFMPDRVKGNDGPPVSVPIVNGEYKTMPGQGTIGRLLRGHHLGL